MKIKNSLKRTREYNKSGKEILWRYEQNAVRKVIDGSCGMLFSPS
jgi:hypothetical protein